MPPPPRHSIEPGPIPKHAQLKEILTEVCHDDLRPGDSLPSERVLAEVFGVSRITVRRAIGDMVADGVHLSDAMVDLVRVTTGPSGITLVSDAMAATGMPDGDYVLGALPVTVTGGVAQMTSSTAAKAAGFGDRGTIAVRKRADLLLCDDTPARNPAPRDGRAPTPPTVITAGKRKER